jgi:hypothetical protein
MIYHEQSVRTIRVHQRDGDGRIAVIPVHSILYVVEEQPGVPGCTIHLKAQGPVHLMVFAAESAAEVQTLISEST